MKPKVLEELEQSLVPYLFFWDEWTANDNCNLTRQEVDFVNIHLTNAFKIGVFESLVFHNKVKTIEEIIRKLKLGYQIFKDFVIVNFLFTITTMARQYGYNKFLESPIHQLEISESMKEILKSFKAYTLQQLFIIYKAEDFGRGWVYKKIIEFQTQVKQESMINH